MLKSTRWEIGFVISIVVIGMVLLARGWIALQSEEPAPQQMLGISLPHTTTNLNIEIQSSLLGRLTNEYNAYLRFELAFDDVDTLLADSAFQPTITSKNPFVRLGAARRGETSMATFAQRESPVWWNPPQEGTYLLTSRSRPEASASYTGPDLSWYVIDISDSVHAIVYVYVVEV